MKLAFCTYMWNHHLGSICIEIAKYLKDDFKMLLSLPVDCDAVKTCARCGLPVTPPNEPWIVCSSMANEGKLKVACNEIILKADVAIIGGMPSWASDIIKQRIKEGKLTFFMGERYFKIPRRWFDSLNPWRLWGWYKIYRLFQRTNVHYLTMSHWCAEDLAFFHACKDRIWRWGYLTPVSEKPTEKLASENLRLA